MAQEGRRATAAAARHGLRPHSGYSVECPAILLLRAVQFACDVGTEVKLRFSCSLFLFSHYKWEIRFSFGMNTNVNNVTLNEICRNSVLYFHFFLF